MTGTLRAAVIAAALTLSACVVATETPRQSPQGAHQAAPQRSYAEESCLAAVAWNEPFTSRRAFGPNRMPAGLSR